MANARSVIMAATPYRDLLDAGVLVNLINPLIHYDTETKQCQGVPIPIQPDSLATVLRPKQMLAPGPHVRHLMTVNFQLDMDFRHLSDPQTGRINIPRVEATIQTCNVLIGSESTVITGDILRALNNIMWKSIQISPLATLELMSNAMTDYINRINADFDNDLKNCKTISADPRRFQSAFTSGQRSVVHAPTQDNPDQLQPPRVALDHYFHPGTQRLYRFERPSLQQRLGSPPNSPKRPASQDPRPGAKRPRTQSKEARRSRGQRRYDNKKKQH